MMYRKTYCLALKLVCISALLLIVISGNASGEGDTLAWWRFEQVKQINGSMAVAAVDKPLTADDRRPADPQPFAWDNSGKDNFLQVRGSRPSPNVFSGDVPVAFVNGMPNTRSLAIKKGEYVVSFERSLAFYDMQKSWAIEASLRNNLLGTEQVFLCKEGAKGAMAADVSIGFDNMQRKYFVEVMCADGKPRRIVSGEEVVAGKWYDVKAQGIYDSKAGMTTLRFEVRSSGQTTFNNATTIRFKGPALNRNAGMWVIGRGYPSGFPNNQAVLDGAIDEVLITGEALPRKLGQNPIFTDAFTADPAALVVGDEVFVYVGLDAASVGGWFTMPQWLCYSTKDMKNWKAHGPVLAAKDFEGANANSSWAAQVVKKGSKYYFYVTLDGKYGHFITVAVGDSPTGPFKEVTPGKPLVIDSMTKDSHRPNSDIDPTVIIDDDGTAWLAWGNGDCYMAKLKSNMTELDGPITKMPFRNYSEGPWLFKRGNLYYNVYAADAPGVQPEQMCYSTASKITGPWTYGGFVTGAAKHGFTIHPAVIEFKKQWYFFYHDGSYSLNGTPGGDTRRSVCVEYLYFNPDGSIKPITLTTEGVSIPSKK
jgi:Glycosyl hydrolases family 43